MYEGSKTLKEESPIKGRKSSRRSKKRVITIKGCFTHLTSNSRHTIKKRGKKNLEKEGGKVEFSRGGPNKKKGRWEGRTTRSAASPRGFEKRLI